MLEDLSVITQEHFDHWFSERDETAPLIIENKNISGLDLSNKNLSGLVLNNVLASECNFTGSNP